MVPCSRAPFAALSLLLCAGLAHRVAVLAHARHLAVLARRGDGEQGRAGANPCGKACTHESARSVDASEPLRSAQARARGYPAQSASCACARAEARKAAARGRARRTRTERAENTCTQSQQAFARSRERARPVGFEARWAQPTPRSKLRSVLLPSDTAQLNLAVCCVDNVERSTAPRTPPATVDAARLRAGYGAVDREAEFVLLMVVGWRAGVARLHCNTRAPRTLPYAAQGALVAL